MQNNKGGQSFFVQNSSENLHQNFLSIVLLVISMYNETGGITVQAGLHVPVTNRRLNLTWTYRKAFAQWERCQELRGKTNLRSSSDWLIAETEALVTVYRIELADQECGCGSILPAWLALGPEVFLPCEALWGHVGLQVIVGKNEYKLECEWYTFQHTCRVDKRISTLSGAHV